MSGNTGARSDAGDGDDQVYGEAGDDRLTGGPGNDTIDGGDGTDTAVFIGRRADYTVTWSDTTSSFSVSSLAEGTDSLFNIEALTFLDGSFGASSLQNPNVPSAPTLTSVLPLTGATEDTAFTITYAALAAAADEADAQGDPIAFRLESVTSGTLAKNGAAVVAGATRLASGEQLVWTPAMNANGTVAAFRVRALDAALASTDDVPVSVTVVAVNDAPVLASPIADQSATAGSAFSFTVAGGTFTDVDNASLSYVATRADDSPLPTWLTFNPATRTFNGTPTNTDAGTLSLRVAASDGALSARDIFDIRIEAQVPGRTVTGTAAGDALVGAAGPDTLEGGPGDDRLTGGPGSDVLSGGTGLDEAVYTQARTQYQISRAGDGALSVSGPEGTDSLSGVERLVFADQALGFDVQGTGGKAYRLYQAAFDRKPDGGGLGFWMYYFDRGAITLEAMASEFMKSQEFTTLYGANPTNEEFMDLLYRNVMNRTPDDGYFFWLDALYGRGPFQGQSFSRAFVLAQFSESPENQANVVGAMQQGFEYQPFVPPGG